MKPKTTTDTQSVKTITEHMVNVHVPYCGQQYHFQVVVTVADGVCEVESDRIYIVGWVDAVNADTLSTIAERAALKHVKEWLKVQREGKMFDTFLDLSREDVRHEGYDDKELSDDDMVAIAEDMAQEDTLMEAWHDALSELLRARGVPAYDPDEETISPHAQRLIDAGVPADQAESYAEFMQITNELGGLHLED